MNWPMGSLIGVCVVPEAGTRVTRGLEKMKPRVDMDEPLYHALTT